MQDNRTIALATVLVVSTGSLWGFYWLPVRRLAELGLTGAWGTLAIVATAAAVLAPFALRARRRGQRVTPAALAAIALGGVAFVLYSAGLAYGRVAIVILLFFMTPVWSTLLARFVMGWPIPRLRLLAILVGMLGLGLVLGADGGLPLPRGLGDWLGLLSGLLWAVATTVIRTQPATPASVSAWVFALGACAGAAVLAPLLAPWPMVAAADLAPALGWALGGGALWWGLSIAGLMWAAARLEPARVGILLMAEVLVGVVSAAAIAGERLGPLELAGAVLVVGAGVLEVWPLRTPAGAAPGRRRAAAGD
jgi:drug/metabolite transporter (DMT)-like permease